MDFCVEILEMLLSLLINQNLRDILLNPRCDLVLKLLIDQLALEVHMIKNIPQVLSTEIVDIIRIPVGVKFIVISRGADVFAETIIFTTDTVGEVLDLASRPQQDVALESGILDATERLGGIHGREDGQGLARVAVGKERDRGFAIIDVFPSVCLGRGRRTGIIDGLIKGKALVFGRHYVENGSVGLKRIESRYNDS